MSNFWATSDGENAAKETAGEFDSGGGDFEIIPAKTIALASIVSAVWQKDRDNNRYVNIHWSIDKPGEYANQRLFQKIWCGDDDPRAKDPAKKRDKALRMLAAIDANAGGKLAKAGREPDDDDLALALTNKQMMITIMVWEMDGKEGNWVSAVAAKGSKDVTVVAAKTEKGGQSSQNDVLDDDVPFATCDFAAEHKRRMVL